MNSVVISFFFLIKQRVKISNLIYLFLFTRTYLFYKCIILYKEMFYVIIFETQYTSIYIYLYFMAGLMILNSV